MKLKAQGRCNNQIATARGWARAQARCNTIQWTSRWHKDEDMRASPWQWRGYNVIAALKGGRRVPYQPRMDNAPARRNCVGRGSHIGRGRYNVTATRNCPGWRRTQDENTWEREHIDATTKLCRGWEHIDAATKLCSNKMNTVWHNDKDTWGRRERTRNDKDKWIWFDTRMKTRGDEGKGRQTTKTWGLIKSINIVSINAALYILILSPSNSKTPTHYNKSHNLNCLHHHHHNPNHVVCPMEVIYGGRPNALGWGGNQSVGVIETRLCAMHLFLAR